MSDERMFTPRVERWFPRCEAIELRAGEVSLGVIPVPCPLWMASAMMEAAARHLDERDIGADRAIVRQTSGGNYLLAYVDEALRVQEEGRQVVDALAAIGGPDA